MEQIVQQLSRPVAIHDLEAELSTVLDSFPLLVEEFESYISNCKPSKETKQQWAFFPCSCRGKEPENSHYVPKKLAARTGLFIDSRLGLGPLDSRFITHNIIGFAKSNQSSWLDATPKNSDPDHVLAQRLEVFLKTKKLTKEDSDSENEFNKVS
jgi:hypothetical protein